MHLSASTPIDPILTALAFLLAAGLLTAAVLVHRAASLGGVLRGLSVRDYMLTDVVTIPAYIPLSELGAERALRAGYRSFPVMRGETVVGLLLVSSVLAVLAEARDRTSVQAVMMRLDRGTVAEPGESLLGAMGRMARTGARSLLVIEDGRLEGLLVSSHVRRRAAAAL